jgi:hypothetical protein
VTIVGLSGLARSGKSTAAAHLVSHRGFTRVRFADPLKAMMRSLGLSHDEIEGNRKELPCEMLLGKSPRHAMQTLGTEWARDCISPDFWVALWWRTASDVLDHGGKVVCDDCRFENEVAAIHKIGGRVIQIKRDGAGTASRHVSEGFAFKADEIVSNNGSVEDMFAEIDLMV